jgi:ABC-type oligopeptide transport system ATPase subunit
MTSRSFEDREAVREPVPLLVGIVGPSGTGKTKSALRLAGGMQRVSGGEIFVVDTESKRALHYAGSHRFRHIDFQAPHSPLDYLAVFEHCSKKGARTIVVDSQSHEHEGQGGVLEMHETELDRMAGTDWTRRKAMDMLAWSKPKQARRRLINAIVQMPCNFVFCFRAKQKIKPVKGGEPISLGWMPIAGDEFVFEMTVKFLLLPGANGIPTLRSDFPGEREIIKQPEQFRPLLGTPTQLNEDIGEQLTRWAAGGEAPKASPVDELVRRFDACADHDSLAQLERQRGAAWQSLSRSDKTRLKAAAEAAKRRAELAARSATDGANEPDDPGEANVDEPAFTPVHAA